MTTETTGKGARTRARIMDIAEAAVLAKGFAATSIEEIITEAGITRSAFFYHFPDKNSLAKALMERYLERDGAFLDEVFDRGIALNEDPLHGFLVGLKLLAEMMADLPGVHPGCLAATLCYQDQQFSPDIRALWKHVMLVWRRRFRAQLDLIVERYPPREPVDLDALADMVTTTVDGGILLSRAVNDAAVLPRQIMLYRTFIRTLFMPGA